jgi:hypothetical protein
LTSREVREVNGDHRIGCRSPAECRRYRSTKYRRPFLGIYAGKYANGGSSRGSHGLNRFSLVKKSIHPGEELFMDYGQEYFTSGVKSGTPRAEGKR